MSYNDTAEERRSIVHVLYCFTEAAARKAGGRGPLEKKMAEALSPDTKAEIDTLNARICQRLHQDFYRASLSANSFTPLASDIVTLAEKQAEGYIRIFGWDEVATFLPEQADRDAFLEFRAPVLAGLCRR